MGQRIFLFILGAFTLFIGGLFTYIMGMSYLNAKATRAWTEVPAQLVEAKVEQRQIGEFVPVDYAAAVAFTYEYEGTAFRSTLLTPRGQKWAKERKKAEHELGALKAGMQTICWVNPEDPSVAILKHDTKAAGYSIWFPLLFVIGGGGVMVGALRKRRTA